MDSERGWLRPAGIGGIASVVLVVAAKIVAGSAPGVSASPTKITSYYAQSSHWHRQQAGLIIGALSMVFFLWFLGGLRARLRASERDGALLSTVALGAGVAFAILYAALSTMRGVIPFALDSSNAFRAATLDPQMVRGFEQAHDLFFLYALVAGAIMIGASSVLALRTYSWANWLSVAGIAIAVLVLIGAFVAAGAVFLVLIWIVAVGLALGTPTPTLAGR